MSRVIRRVVLLLALIWIPMAWAADRGPILEEHIKAAFLFKFAGYVEWPSPSIDPLDPRNLPFTIGVMGADKIAEELIHLSRDNNVNDRPVLIKTLRPGDSLAGLDILFIGRRERSRLQSLLNQAKAQPILTVTESRGALEAGSVINFVPVEDYIRFEISVASAELCGLKISSRLLNVAQNIETRRP